MWDLAEMCYNCNCLILDVDVAKPGTHKKENCNPFPPNILSELAPLSPLRDRQSPIYQITQESALPLTSTRFFTKDLFIQKKLNISSLNSFLKKTNHIFFLFVFHAQPSPIWWSTLQLPNAGLVSKDIKRLP